MSGLEIERKFLVHKAGRPYAAQATSSSRIRQGYICSERGRTVRVRIRDGRGFITIKGPSDGKGMSRYEFEKEITLDEASHLTLVEVTLEAPREEAHVVLLQFRLIPFLDEPVLLVDDGEVRQHLDCLAPRPVYGFVLRCGHGVDFGERHLESAAHNRSTPRFVPPSGIRIRANRAVGGKTPRRRGSGAILRPLFMRNKGFLVRISKLFCYFCPTVIPKRSNSQHS